MPLQTTIWTSPDTRYDVWIHPMRPKEDSSSKDIKWYLTFSEKVKTCYPDILQGNPSNSQVTAVTLFWCWGTEWRGKCMMFLTSNDMWGNSDWMMAGVMLCINTGMSDKTELSCTSLYWYEEDFCGSKKKKGLSYFMISMKLEQLSKSKIKKERWHNKLR